MWSAGRVAGWRRERGIDITGNESRGHGAASFAPNGPDADAILKDPPDDSAEP